LDFCFLFLGGGEGDFSESELLEEVEEPELLEELDVLEESEDESLSLESLLFEALILSASFLFSAFSSKLDEFVLLVFPWMVSLILRFRVVVLESLCTYFLSPLHSYVQ